MKKIIFVLFLVFGIFTFVQAQRTYPLKSTKNYLRVDGFDGDKPLKRDKKVEVFLITPQEPIKFENTIFLEKHQAYKGETEEIFVKRFLETVFYKKDTRALKSQLNVKTSLIGLSLGSDQKKMPTWVYGVLVLLLVFVVFWGLFGEVDKDPRKMTQKEKDKYLENMEKEREADKKRAQKRELKKITKQLAKELKKPVL